MGPVTRVALIRIEVYRPILRFLTSAGVRVEAHLERAGLPLRAFDRPEVLVPLHQTRLFLGAVARREGVDDLGLAAGSAAGLEEMGTFGTTVRGAPTVAALIETLILAVPSFNSGARWWVESHGATVSLCHTFVGRRDGIDSQAEQFTLGIALGTLRLAGGPRWRPHAIQLAVGDHRPRLDGHPLLGDVPLYLHPQVTKIAFDTTLLARRIAPLTPPAPPSLDVLSQWREYGPAARVADLVSQVLVTLSAGGRRPTIAATADALGLRVRTLQRWLAADGHTFDDLVDRDRLRTALYLLEQTDARVLDIALDLGYSDHAHFTRAFRRWTGVSPQAYRRGHAGAAAATG